MENLHFIALFLSPSLFLVKEIGGKTLRINWRRKPLEKHVNEVAFRGDSHLPDEIKSMSSPLEIFNYFFNDTIIDLIVSETNRAASRDAEGSDFIVTPDEIRHYIGILVFMSVFRYPNLEAYWGKFAFPPIQKAMT